MLRGAFFSFFFQLKGVFLQLGGGIFLQPGSLSHGPMIKHNRSFLETPVRTQLPQLAAGSPAPHCAALFAFYGPALPLQ